MIIHIYECTKEYFTNTEFKDNFYFFHDALLLMTSKGTVEWMKEKGIYKHWLLPMKGLNEGTRYAGRPVGDSPELMPLDSTLNKDVDDAVKMHVAYISHLLNTDKRKFSMATPSKGIRAYKNFLIQ